MKDYWLFDLNLDFFFVCSFHEVQYVKDKVNQPFTKPLTLKETILNPNSPKTSDHQSVSSKFVGTNSKNPLLPDILVVKYGLETIIHPAIPSTAFASISGKTLTELLRCLTLEQFMRHYILIDCRYPFEYKGGHIQGACNLFDPAKIEDFFFPENYEQRRVVMAKKPIFYCEFSQKRGPFIAHELRALDRLKNAAKYPTVDYPEMYLLENGYSKFYLQYSSAVPELFEPLGYVKMKDSRHRQERSTYKFHLDKPISSIFPKFSSNSYIKHENEIEEELSSNTMKIDNNMKTPPRALQRHLRYDPSVSSSQKLTPDYPETPKGRPLADRIVRGGIENARKFWRK